MNFLKLFFFFYLKQNSNTSTYTTGLESPIDFAYESYSEWLNAHEDLKLGANILSNKQLFWVARAVFEYRKLHREVPFAVRILGNFFNGLNFEHDFRLSKNFQDAFGCQMETNVNKSFQVEKFDELFSNFGIDFEEFIKLLEKFKFLG